MKKLGVTAWRVLIVVLVSCVAFGMLAHTNRSAETLSKVGSQGSEVTKIQTKLQDLGIYSAKIDGVYGSATKSAVVTFQKQQGITADGIAGTQTLKALGITGSSSDSTGGIGKYSSNDIKLLATIVSAEARGEPYEGQVAVAAVILNRVEHPSFPNTLAGVIYQPGAFSCLTDGGVNAEVADSAYKAVRDAINGWDPSGGAVYYYNPAKSTSKWIFSRPVITVIGNHRFCS
ncbi:MULTISPECIES: spore cortex-lytic enzyme [Caproicibacterium]